MSNNYPMLSRYSRGGMLVSYFVLILLITLGTLVWPSCNRSPNGVIWAIQMLLLLPFLPAIVRQKVRSLAWLTFILLGFFMASVSTAFACTSWLTVTEVLMTMFLFIFTMFHIRWRSRELKSKL